MTPVDLVMPVKSLEVAKSRLRGAADRGVGDQQAHAALALAMALDTVAAVRATGVVRRLLLVCSDPVVAAECALMDVDVVPDGPVAGLNASYAHGAAILRGRDARAAVGALQADLPALRPDELDEAVRDAVSGFATASRAFVEDAEGTGTTFLLAAPGTDLDPRFGAGSAHRHEASGARRLSGGWPGLRRDVDTSDDLCAAARIGLGSHTRAVLAPSSQC